MEEIKLTQSDVAEILADKIGIELKTATISRYNKNGLILMPKRFPNYFNGVSRIYYHPSVPVEIAAAYLLFRGDWLKLDSEFRLSRASTQDVYLGRLLFYLSQYNPDNIDGFEQDIPLNFAEFFTSANLFTTDFEGASKMFPMDFSSIKSYVSSYYNAYLESFKAFNIVEPYLQYIGSVYRVTYLNLYSTIYGPHFRTIPDNVRLSAPPRPF